jgi:hypothetical protein
MRGPIFLLFIRAILLMHQIKRPTGHWRSFIGLWAVGSFGITNTSFRFAVTANGWMVGSFLRLWALMPRYVRPTVGVPLSAKNINTLMQCIWILLLVIASPSAVSDMLSSWLTMLHDTTGHLVCGISCRTPSSLSFGYFVLRSYCNCDHKLFGTAISKYLIDNLSKVVAAPAKWQSSNGLVKSH